MAEHSNATTDKPWVQGIPADIQAMLDETQGERFARLKAAGVDPTRIVRAWFVDWRETVMYGIAKTLCDRLERRIAALEQRSDESLHYRGIWRSNEAYSKGNATTHSGSLWIAESASIGVRPGSPEGRDRWRLAVKKNSLNTEAER